MEENQNNSWDEISDEMAEVKRKIKDKVTIENSIDDLKNSFQSIIENSKDTKLVEKTSESIKLEFLFFLESFLKIPQYPSGETLL